MNLSAADNFLAPGLVAVNEVAGAHALLAFHLQLVNLQRGAVSEAQQQAFILDREVSRSNDGDLRQRGVPDGCASILPRKWVNAPGQG